MDDFGYNDLDLGNAERPQALMQTLQEYGNHILVVLPMNLIVNILSQVPIVVMEPHTLLLIKNGEILWVYQEHGLFPKKVS